jgi:hypothetical protein
MNILPEPSQHPTLPNSNSTLPNSTFPNSTLPNFQSSATLREFDDSAKNIIPSDSDSEEDKEVERLGGTSATSKYLKMM